jgi:hypothetical protein
MSSPLIIRICRHTFLDGQHCHGPAVRGRACCRHHLNARTRLHNIARARRVASFARLCVPMNRRDVASNRAEVMRVINTGSLDFATARMLLWSMDLAVATFPAEPKTRRDRPHNPNVSYHVPISPLFPRTASKTHRKSLKTHGGRGGGVI